MMEKLTKVPFDHIEAMMDSLTFRFARIGPTTTTVCYAYLPDGFRVGHGDSACVDADNFDYELGKKFAKQNAVKDAYDNLWGFEGYLLHRTGDISAKFEYAPSDDDCKECEYRTECELALQDK